MNPLPPELKIKIFKHLIPDESYNINEFKSYFLIYRDWFDILNSFALRIYYSKILGLYYDLIKVHPLKYVHKVLTYDNILQYSGYKYVSQNYSGMMIDIFGYNKLINLPFCKFKRPACIDNKCHFIKSPKCYLRHHGLNKYITAPIMRGMDILKRNYLLFVYTDKETNEIMYEFIYNKIINNQIVNSYSGIYNKTYIGVLSDNKIITNYHSRKINTFSYIYIKKLINGDLCRIPKYCPETNQFYESNEGDIRLYV
jgi:hypothetical protein